jgi:hypothetical protein
MLLFFIVFGLAVCSKVEYDFKLFGFAEKTGLTVSLAKGNQTKHRLDEISPKVAAVVLKSPVDAVVPEPKSEKEKKDDDCVAAKMAAFRKEKGEGATVKFDILHEWALECKNS